MTKVVGREAGNSSIRHPWRYTRSCARGSSSLARALLVMAGCELLLRQSCAPTRSSRTRHHRSQPSGPRLVFPELHGTLKWATPRTPCLEVAGTGPVQSRPHWSKLPPRRRPQSPPNTGRGSRLHPRADPRFVRGAAPGRACGTFIFGPMHTLSFMDSNHIRGSRPGSFFAV